MNRREHPTDKYVRRLPLVSDEQAALLSNRSAKQALFEEITTMPTSPDIVPPSAAQTAGGQRVPRRTLVLVTVMSILSLAAIGGAAVMWPPEKTTSVSCHTDTTTETVVDSVTGDPVEDCKRAWRDTGQEPPALIAYDNGQGGISVLPAEEQAPDGWEPMDSGAVQDPHLIQLKAALADYGSGLHAKCHAVPEARDVAEREIDRLELKGWSVRAERGEADGTSTCTYFYLDPANRAVVLIPEEEVAPPDGPFTAFARELSTVLEEDCLAVPEAAQVARETAVQHGVDEGLIVHKVTDGTLDCARSDVTVGGGVEVTVRGPEGNT